MSCNGKTCQSAIIKKETYQLTQIGKRSSDTSHYPGLHTYIALIILTNIL